MQSTDRQEFEMQLKTLCAGFNVPLGDRIEAYWAGCQKMSLLEFTRCVEYALGENGSAKIPTTGQLWLIKHTLRSQGAASNRVCDDEPLPPKDHPALAHVNSLFLRYLMRRRVIEGFKGDINLAERRRMCRSIADDFERFINERDPDATPEAMTQWFDAAMMKIPDAETQGALKI